MSDEQQLAKWLEGDLEETDREGLLVALQEDENLREAANRQLFMRRLLRGSLSVSNEDFCREVLLSIQEGEREDAKREEAENVVSFIKTHRNKRRRQAWLAMVGVAACLAVAMTVLIREDQESQSAIKVVAAEGVGTLNSKALESGELIKLSRGILELELHNDTRVVIEAPASFKVLSPRLLQLDLGRCFAEMRKGKSGLRIKTPSGEVLDLGTKFAVDVPSAEEMKVHVFDGEVEVSGNLEKTRLTQGQGLSVTREGAAKKEKANAALFITRVPQGVATGSTHLHWAFDEGTGSVVHAEGTAEDLALARGQFSSHDDAPGSISWTEGVKGSALEFDRQSWVATRHPGVSGGRDRTVACWVRLPAEESTRESAPLIAWGMKRDLGGERQAWMLSVAKFRKPTADVFGCLCLSIGGVETYGTTNLRDGRWHHVAAVAMHEDHGVAILLYVNGQLEAVHRGISESLETVTETEEAKPVQFGRHLFRSTRQLLRGSLDEVYLFESALSGDEIRQLMDGTSQVQESW